MLQVVHKLYRKIQATYFPSHAQESKDNDAAWDMIKKNFNTRASLFQKVQCENKGRYMYGTEIRAAYSYVSVAVVSNIPEKEIGKAAKVLEVSGEKH